ncbi:hypothetical protein [Pedobacter nutrimenti]|uniref:hypothetical protein n=1 Tax=Pedobacter nutrimenti TaxID=1241337 RepID=UPI002931DF61|nr:hypothetical protein [Pedobacter nutrimenti]
MKNDSEQADKLIFFQLLGICCEKIAVKVGKEDISEWKNSDYEMLSRQLFNQTKVRLSPETLKRVFGKLKTSTRYYPQAATRDALVQFLGYRDWYEFELMNSVQNEKAPLSEKIDIPVADVVPPVSVTPPKRTYTSYKYSLLIVLILLSASVLYFFVFNHQNAGQVKLVCVNPEGIMPHSAIFKLKGNKTDTPSDLVVDFGDGKKRKSIGTDQIVNHYYEHPGRFFPKLYHENTILDTTIVYLKSNGWTIQTHAIADTAWFQQIKLKNTDPNNVFTASAAEVAAAGIDTNKTFLVSFLNIKPTDISADNLQMTAYMKTSLPRKGVRCSQADIVIYGERDIHYIDIIKPECAVWAGFKFSENLKDGETTDLRSLGHDLTSGANIILNIANKKVKLLINNQLVFQTHYNKPIGKVMGIKIMFTGIGQFKNFQLKDLKTGSTL